MLLLAIYNYILTHSSNHLFTLALHFHGDFNILLFHKESLDAK